MNISASEGNSGGESGWTSYLDQSSCSATRYQRDGGIVDDDYRRKGTKQNNDDADDDDDEEEDLSMVSDASSGPPHFNEDEDCFGEDGCSYSSSTSSKSAKKGKKKKKIKKHGGKQQHPYTDDTASSPVFNKKSLGLSDDQVSMQNALRQGFSGTQFKGKSAFQKHFGLFQSVSEKPTSKEPGKF